MPAIIKDRLPLFIILLVFVALKIPHLHYAYFWDESWPYAVGIKAMYQHGISLVPGAIDGILSRGHPLFFHAVAAAWMNVFGSSTVSMHSFALLISILLLIAIYETGLRMFDQRVAFLALLLVATQEMFFIQSSLVLFEVLVAFLCFLSIVFYTNEKYFLTGLCLTMAFYTKESALVAGFVLGLDALISFADKKVTRKKRLSKILAVGLPVLFIGFFFLAQKRISGWYILPLYNESIKHSWDDYWYLFRVGCIRTVFQYQLKYLYFLILVLMAVISVIKQKRVKLLIILLPAILLYFLTKEPSNGIQLAGVAFFIAFLFSAVVFLYTYTDKKYLPGQHHQKLTMLLGIFTLCFLCFSAMNYFIPRYMLAAIIPALFVVAVFLDNAITLVHRRLYYPVILLVLIISSFAYYQNDSFGDCDRGMYDALVVEQGVVDYFEMNVKYDQNISAQGSLESTPLSDTASGFLHTSNEFTNITWNINESTWYIVFDNLLNDERRDKIKYDTTFYLATRIAKGRVWAEIYKRK